jgi:hypothetical protein
MRGLSLRIIGFLHRNGWLLLRAVLFAALGKAILTWLDSVGIHPDAWLLRMMGYAITPSSLQAMSWVIAAAAAVVGATLWEATNFTQMLQRWWEGSAAPSAAHPKMGARERCLGFSAHMVLRLRDVAAIRRKYIFDFGTPEGARVAFYLSASDRFILEAKDVRGETYPLEVPFGGNGIPIGKFVYLSAEVGLEETSTFLSVAVNGIDVQRRTLGFRIDLGSRKWSGGTIGSDAAGKNNAGFDLGEFWGYPTTLATQEAEQLCAYFLKTGGLVDVNPQARRRPRSES